MINDSGRLQCGGNEIAGSHLGDFLERMGDTCFGKSHVCLVWTEEITIDSTCRSQQDT